MSNKKEKNKKKKNSTKNKNAAISAQNKTIIALILFSFLLYGNTIPNGFSLDDNYVSAGNEQIAEGIKAIPEIFTSFYAQDTKTAFAYRPIVKITYAIEHQFTGGSAHFSHFTNILLYALTLVFLFLVVSRMLRNYNKLVPLLIILIFAAHPAHTEVVASLKNRDELLSFLFAILGLYQAFRFVDTKKTIHLVYLGLFYLLGYWSKVSILVFLIIIPLALWYFSDTNWKNILLVIGVLALASVAGKFIPHLYLPRGSRPKFFFENPLLFERKFSVKVATGMFILLFYLKQLIFPHPLLFYYGYNMIPLVNFNNGWVIVSIIVFAALGVYALWKIKSKDPISFFILFMLGTLFIYSNIIKQHTGIVADRFLNAALLAFSVFLVFGVFRFFRTDLLAEKIPRTNFRKLMYFFTILLAVYSIRTIDRNRDWKDLFTLMENDIQYLDNSAKANSLYGGELLNKAYVMITNHENVQEINHAVNLAEKHLLRSFEIYPNNYVVLNNLGSLYYSIKADYPRAIHYFKKAIKEDPFRASEAYYNIAKSYEKLNKPHTAVGYFLESINYNEQFEQAYIDLGDFYYKLNKMDSAIYYQAKLMEVKPDLDIPYLRISKYYLYEKDTTTAVSYMEKALVVNPDNYRLCINLRDFYSLKGNMDKAGYYGSLSLKAKH